MTLMNPGNQRKAAATIRGTLLIRALILTTLLGATGLGYVWQKNKIYLLGNEIRKGEMELKALRERQALLQVQMAQEKSPRALWEKCQQWKLGLEAPKEIQIVRLVEPTNSLLPPPPKVAVSTPGKPAPVNPAPSSKVARANPRERGG